MSLRLRLPAREAALATNGSVVTSGSRTGALLASGSTCLRTTPTRRLPAPGNLGTDPRAAVSVGEALVRTAALAPALAAHRQAAATRPAHPEPRQQVVREDPAAGPALELPAGPPEILLPRGAEARVDRFPEILRDDPQLGLLSPSSRPCPASASYRRWSAGIGVTVQDLSDARGRPAGDTVAPRRGSLRGDRNRSATSPALCQANFWDGTPAR